MKKLLVIALALLFGVPCAYAQTQKQISKNRTEISKLSKSELNAKASKVARKAAKKYVKEGWSVSPGALPLEKQIDKAFGMQYEYDENLFPKFIMGEAMSIGENYDAAKMQALELAKQSLAAQIQTEVTALIDNSVANKELAEEQAVSIAETVLGSKNLISQSIGRVIPIVECYRTKSNGNKEVLVRIAYNSEMALEVAKNAVREQLEQKGAKLHEQLDQVLGF